MEYSLAGIDWQAMSDNAYFESRLAFDKKRNVLWRTLARAVFQPMISVDATVLELGAGYCDLINSIEAHKRIGIDMWPGFVRYADPDVKAIVGSILDLECIEDNSLDLVMASNIFEHITQADFATCLLKLKQKMKSGGNLLIIQPNFKYAYRDYFDDYTHQSIWTDVSLSDFLAANGFTVVEVKPKFLPLSVKSRFPVHPILIWLYLYSPWKPFAQQMFLRVRPNIL